ncbi:hypothetical protein F5050DRAFT_1230494 [Lentinula boryana]|uniref:Uncharacterized protein n=1 Tax=Lentinula boryana TaxID=40481 RepID=A0ABQ8PXY2_9AGAR|nr:hypothetical protein F5050DRAFT_1230494 [Lentinula boryana]
MIGHRHLHYKLYKLSHSKKKRSKTHWSAAISSAQNSASIDCNLAFASRRSSDELQCCCTRDPLILGLLLRRHVCCHTPFSTANFFFRKATHDGEIKSMVSARINLGLRITVRRVPIQRYRPLSPSSSNLGLSRRCYTCTHSVEDDTCKFLCLCFFKILLRTFLVQVSIMQLECYFLLLLLLKIEKRVRSL